MNNNIFLTKNKSLLMKGIAIVLMISLHLFAFPSWLKNGNEYYPILKIINIEYILGKFGGICVAIYLFLSGYGLEQISNKISLKNSMKKIYSIYKNYWVITGVFFSIGYIFFELKFEYTEFILNILGVKPTYNVFAWFIRLYIQLLLIFPFLKKKLDKSLKEGLKITSVIYVITIGNPIFFFIFKNLKYIRETFFYEIFYSLGFWQLLFCLGYIFSRYKLYNMAYEIFIKYKINKKKYFILGIFFIVFIRIISSNLVGKIILFDIFMLDFILAPSFIMFCILLFSNTIFEEIFISLGKHSTNMWLTHSFFTLTYFQRITYFPKYSIIILIWTLFLNIIISKIIIKVLLLFEKINIRGRNVI